MTTEWQRYEHLADYARHNPVVFTLVQGLPLNDLLDRLDVSAREFALLPPAGSVTFDFDAGRIIGLLRDDPTGWVVVSEQAHRFDGIDFVAAAPEHVRAISVSFFHNGLFEFADQGQLRRVFELVVYNPEGALAEEHDLPLDDVSLRIPALMMLVERITGVEAEQSWFTGPFPYVWAPEA